MITALVFLIIVLAREYTIALERREWACERRELLNRVQRPEVLPSPQIADFVIPEVEPDEFDLVGVVRDEYVEQTV